MNDIKATLEAEAARLTKDLNELGVENPDVPGDWVTTTTGPTQADENIVADRVERFDTRRAELAQLETRYRNITRALEKITNGTYGSCEICKQSIETDRLAVNAAARTCKTHLEDEASLSE